MTHLGWGIDKLKGNLFLWGSGDLVKEGLSKNEHFLLGTNTTSLNYDKVILYNTITGETSHRSNLLISKIGSCSSVILSFSLSYSVNLLIQFSSMVITILTCSSNGEHNSSGMPSTNTTNLSVTSMCLLLQMLNTESLDNTLNSVTLGNTNNVDHFVLLE